MLNLGLAYFLSEKTFSDQCVWYFINLFLDTFLGIFICLGFMVLINKLALKFNIKELQSGNYFERKESEGKFIEKLNLKIYFIQLFTWLLIVILVYLDLKYFRLNLYY